VNSDAGQKTAHAYTSQPRSSSHAAVVLLTTLCWHAHQHRENQKLCKLSHVFQRNHVSLILQCLHHCLYKHITSTLIQKHTTAHYMPQQTTYCIGFLLSVLTEIIAEHNVDEHKAERASPSHQGNQMHRLAGGNKIFTQMYCLCKRGLAGSCCMSHPCYPSI
jgi:zinc transporter ZupT